ncbi:DNA-methyltransferase [Kozakia baliensis]|uniref:DNA-methyltransferase n=1 Tax=Kozakia baliensis TaxID=153496 RepID=UPI000495EEAC|nr:site-specific DNA-methyltransferase [Kozakia baliensis]AOX19342.1 DNA methyltransferase [Kozakia baliensis]
MTQTKTRSRRESVGRHTLIRGDALNVLRRMPAASVDVAVTSPPYNIGLAYRSYRDRRTENDYLDWMADICAQVGRVLKPGGSFFLNIAGSSSQPWLPFELMVRLRDIFVLQNHITWIKSVAIDDITHGHFKPVNSPRYVNRNHEHVFHLTHHGDVPVQRLAAGVPFTDKSNIARRNHAVDRRCRGDTWFIPYETVQTRKQKFLHPGTFPVALPTACLTLHGIDAQSVLLDPFMGTGTSLLAAEGMGIRGIGIEIDTRYVAVARERLREKISAQKTSS